MWLASVIYQVSTGGGNQPPPVDPGNDPILTLLSTILFLGISIGAGVVFFKLKLRRMGFHTRLTQPTVIQHPFENQETKKGS
jgi:hypothetical protein